MEHRDTHSVVEAAQAIADELVLEKLLETLTRILVEQAGAQRGSVLLCHQDDWSIGADARVEGERIAVCHGPMW